MCIAWCSFWRPFFQYLPYNRCALYLSGMPAVFVILSYYYCYSARRWACTTWDNNYGNDDVTFRIKNNIQCTYIPAQCSYWVLFDFLGVFFLFRFRHECFFFFYFFSIESTRMCSWSWCISVFRGMKLIIRVFMSSKMTQPKHI